MAHPARGRRPSFRALSPITTLRPRWIRRTCRSYSRPLQTTMPSQTFSTVSPLPPRPLERHPIRSPADGCLTCFHLACFFLPALNRWMSPSIYRPPADVQPPVKWMAHRNAGFVAGGAGLGKRPVNLNTRGRERSNPGEAEAIAEWLSRRRGRDRKGLWQKAGAGRWYPDPVRKPKTRSARTPPAVPHRR